MARPTIDQIRGLGDFAPLFRWNMQFVNFPAKVNNPPTADALNLRCETSEIPKATNANIEVSIRGHKVNQPGITSYAGTLTFTFSETVDNAIKNFLKNWREAIWATQTGVALGPKPDLQCDILIRQLDNTDKEVWEYKLVGCYLGDYDLGNLDGSSSDVQKPSMILQYDYFQDRSL